MMRWRLVGYALTGLLCYLVFLVTTLPAHWLGVTLARQTQDAVSLRNTQGTAWQGSGILQLRGGAGTVVSTSADWEVQWWPLLTGKLGLRFSTRGELSLQMDLLLGRRSLTLKNTELEMPASLVSAFYAPAMLVAPTGTVLVKATEFSIHSGQVSGELQARWLGAGSKVGAFGELGDYLLVINGQGDVAGLRLETLRGDFKVTGQGEWRPRDSGALQLTGSLIPGARELSLKPLLSLLNSQKINDQYNWTLHNNLPLPAFLSP